MMEINLTNQIEVGRGFTITDQSKLGGAENRGSGIPAHIENNVNFGGEDSMWVDSDIIKSLNPKIDMKQVEEMAMQLETLKLDNSK